MKKYLWIGPDIISRNARYLIDLKNALKWVDTPAEATADYEQAARATQERLTALGLETEPEQIADSKWAIYKRE